MAAPSSSAVTSHWTRVQTLFEHALDRPEDERSAWLRAQCGDDPALYREVEALLDGDRAHHPMFAGHAADLLAEGEIADLLPSRVGERVGAWVLGDKLGEGGMGAVYRAERAEAESPGGFRQTAAVKLVKPGMDSAAVLARFRAERQILARLQHPGIARLLDGGLTEDGRPYFAMELVEGEPITDACDARALSVRARLGLFVRACEAVRYAHRSLVVHRDLKPSNLLVVEGADGLRPILLDFGIARLLDAEGDGSEVGGELTRTGHRVLTPAYAAPEQVRGEAPTTATDVYALGGLLYRLLCGASPVETRDRARHEVEAAILAEEPARPSDRVTAEAARQRGTTEPVLSRQLRGDLDTICAKALAKEPERRYGSAAELLADVERYLGGLPIEARPTSGSYRVRKFVERHRAGVFGTAAAVLAIVVLSGFYTARLATERDRAQAEADKAQEVSAFLASLFESVDPAIAQGDSVTARELLDRGAARIQRELADQPEVQAQMLGTIGEAYRSLGLYDEAEAAHRRSVALADSLGRDPLALARARTLLARLLVERGRYPPADSLLALATPVLREAEAGDDLVVALETIGDLRSENGEYDVSEAPLREALALQRRLHTGDHPRTASLLHTLGQTLVDLGTYDEAGAVYTEALAMKRRLFGDLHPGVSETLRQFSRLRRTERDFARAEPLIRRAIQIDSLIVGTEHPSIGEDYFEYASLLNDMSRFDAATAMYEEAMRVDIATLGPDHPYIALDLQSLGEVRQRAGDAPGAIAYYRRALALQRRVLPADHAEIATTLIKLGQALPRVGDDAGAEQAIRQALAIRRQRLDENHPSVLSDRSALASVLSATGRHDEAIAITRDILARRVLTLGDDNPITARSFYNLAGVLRAKGTPDALAEARTVAADAVRRYREAFPAESREMGFALMEQADVLRESGDLARARPVYREALTAFRASLGPDHPTTQSVAQRLASR